MPQTSNTAQGYREGMPLVVQQQPICTQTKGARVGPEQLKQARALAHHATNIHDENEVILNPEISS